MNILKPMNELLLSAIFGVLTSIVFLFFSPWMSHFVPVIALYHSIVLGAVFACGSFLIMAVGDRFRFYVKFGLIALLSSYLLVWLLKFSSLTSLNIYLQFFLSILVTISFLFLCIVVGRRLRPLVIESYFIPTCLLLLFLVAKPFVLSLIPTSALLIGNPPANISNRFLDSSVSYESVVFPFSKPLLEGVQTYGSFLPTNPSKDGIFFLLLDAFRYDYLGKKLDGKSITPHLDALSQDGLSFPNFYVQSSWTKPSTASLFTGLYPSDHGVIYGGGDRGRFEGHVLPKKYRTLAERLSNEGYKNYGAVMSGHLSDRYNYDQGFHVWIDPGNGFRGDLYTLDQAFFWLLREQPEQPFVYLHVKGPHQPFKSAYMNEDYLKKLAIYRDGKLDVQTRFKFTGTGIVSKINEGEIELTPEETQFLRHLYGAQLNMYDRYLVSPFISVLKNLGLYRDNLLVVTGDHGEELYDHGTYAHGNNLFQETIHTPLIMKFPEEFSSGELPSNFHVESIDLTATLTDYAGGTLKNYRGNSFLGYLTSDKGKNQGEFTRAFSENPEGEKIKQAALVKYPWKYIHNYFEQTGDLYNLREDPDEKNPLASRPEVKEKLRKEIFDTLGSDSVPKTSSVSLKEATKQEVENLEGLGYLE